MVDRTWRHGGWPLAGIACLTGIAVAAPLPAPGPTPAETALFQQRCAACHSLQAGRGGAGPSLAGVVGRKAAAVVGFSYSPALARSGIVWTPAQLDAFLADPQKLVPGTRMPIAVADPAQRRALVRVLAAVK